MWDRLPQLSVPEAREVLGETDLLVLSVPKDPGTSLVNDLALFANTRGLIALISDGTEIGLPRMDRMIIAVDASYRCLASNSAGDLLHGSDIVHTVTALAYQRDAPIVVDSNTVVLPDGGIIPLNMQARHRLPFVQRKTHPAVQWAREFAQFTTQMHRPVTSAWTWADQGEISETAEIFATAAETDIHVTRKAGRILAIASEPHSRVDRLTKPQERTHPFIAFHRDLGAAEFSVTDGNPANVLLVPITPPERICPDIEINSPAGHLIAAATTLLNAPWHSENPDPDDPRIAQFLTIQQHLPYIDIEARVRAVAAALSIQEGLIMVPPCFPNGARYQTYRPGRTDFSESGLGAVKPLIVPDADASTPNVRRSQRRALRQGRNSIVFGIAAWLVCALAVVGFIATLLEPDPPLGNADTSDSSNPLAPFGIWIGVAIFGFYKIRRGINMRRQVRALQKEDEFSPTAWERSSW
ncbi:hypothetical protein SAMN06309944_1790 [Micrococcales bacterium KH10]|nr:hypothetical protein SAMN06309944_1790 [Micrococcales bacterium KH10]